MKTCKEMMKDVMIIEGWDQHYLLLVNLFHNDSLHVYCNLVFIKFLRLDYCLLVVCLDLELSLFEAWSRDVKVANEIIRADALADQQNGGVAIYFPSHLLWFFRQKNVIHLNSKVANEMIRADQYNGRGPSQVHLQQKRVFHEAISAQCIKLRQRWLFESKKS